MLESADITFILEHPCKVWDKDVLEFYQNSRLRREDTLAAYEEADHLEEDDFSIALLFFGGLQDFFEVEEEEVPEEGIPTPSPHEIPENSSAGINGESAETQVVTEVIMPLSVPTIAESVVSVCAKIVILEPVYLLSEITDIGRAAAEIVPDDTEVEIVLMMFWLFLILMFICNLEKRIAMMPGAPLVVEEEVVNISDEEGDVEVHSSILADQDPGLLSHPHISPLVELSSDSKVHVDIPLKQDHFDSSLLRRTVAVDFQLHPSLASSPSVSLAPEILSTPEDSADDYAHRTRCPVLIGCAQVGNIYCFSVSLENKGYLTLLCSLKLAPRLHSIRDSFCPLLSLEKTVGCVSARQMY
ncbi:hypothetical protein KSP40_PGU005677 [Platanthera guangdongensis]|uniref:Uncharacterized protein n=1 Tax=Platanthera guangdongensis TaxID=2320717 RepID=A0ABR2MMG7_9ASPA